MDELKKKRFLWGVALAWVPWIPTIIGLSRALRGIFEQKATGIGTLGAGLVESFVLLGIGTMLAAQVAAIVLLSRAFSPGHWARSLFSVLSICLSGLMLFLVGLFLWVYWFQSRHNF